MRLVFIISLVMLFSIDAQCQSDDDDVIFLKFFELRDRSHKALMNFRSVETSAALPFYYDLARSWYRIKTENPDVYYKGINISYRGIYADTAIQNRILQLLKNEFYEGELDSLVNEKMRYECKYCNLNDSTYQIKKEEIGKYIINTPLLLRNDILGWYLKYVDLIEACSYIDNKEVDAELIKMYNDSRFQEYKRRLRNCILKKNLEPYTTRCLRECKYDSRKSADALEENIQILAEIESQESYKLLSEYLLSDKYTVDVICQDLNIITEDTVVIELDIDVKEQEIEKDFQLYSTEHIHRNYLYREVYKYIRKSIMNNDLYSMLGINDNEPVSDEMLTLSFRRRIYNWMQANYGKYVFRSRW